MTRTVLLAALCAAVAFVGIVLVPAPIEAQVIGCPGPACPPPPPTCPPACPPVDPPTPPPAAAAGKPNIQFEDIGRRFRPGPYDEWSPKATARRPVPLGVCRQKNLRARWYCELREVNRGNPRATVMADVDQICRVGNEAARWQCLRRIRLVYPEIPGCKKTATGRGASTHFAWGLCDDISHGTPLGKYRVANVAKVVGSGAQARVVLSAGPRQYWLRQWPAQVAAHHPARKANGVKKTPRIHAPALDYLVLAQ